MLTGSGEVLMAARTPDLARCVPAARLPPSKAMATCMAVPWSAITAAARAAPAGMRMKVWTLSHREST